MLGSAVMDLLTEYREFLRRSIIENQTILSDLTSAAVQQVDLEGNERPDELEPQCEYFDHAELDDEGMLEIEEIDEGDEEDNQSMPDLDSRGAGSRGAGGFRY
jgi:hypothetical protein